MAFNGTRNFEKQEIVDYLESIGMRFGPDVNAYTGFDETVYMLQVPMDDPEVLATAFRILGDWAGGVVFDPEEVERKGASSSRSGADGAAPGPACRTSSSRSCSRARATPSGSPSATRPSWRTRRPAPSFASTTTGTAPT